MSLLGVQTVICRALLSRRFREEVRVAPETACRPYALQPEELDGIRALRFDDLEKNARYIDGIRVGQVKRRFPLTDRIVWRALAVPSAFYDGWLAALTHETNTHRENTISFAQYVEQAALEAFPDLPPYLPDVADCEYRKWGVRERGPAPEPRSTEGALRFSAARPEHLAWRPARRHVVDAWTARYDVVDLCERLEAGGDLSDARPRTTHVMAYVDPSAKGGLVRLVRVPAEAAELLALCDGTHTVGSLLDHLTRSRPVGEGGAAREGVVRGLEKLGGRQ